jgi:hypothetical protein
MQTSNGLWNQQQLLTFLYPSNSWSRNYLSFMQFQDSLPCLQKPALTNSNVENPSWEANSRSASQGIIRVFYGTRIFITVFTKAYLK